MQNCEFKFYTNSYKKTNNKVNVNNGQKRGATE